MVNNKEVFIPIVVNLNARYNAVLKTVFESVQ